MTGRTLALMVAASVAACDGGASSTTGDSNRAIPRPVPGKLTIGLASVTLANDCGTAPMTEPPQPTTGSSGAARAERSAGSAIGAMPPSAAKRAAEEPCQQSSVQLVVSNLTAASASMQVKSVTVIDGKGARVAELGASKPSRWVGDAYQPWDGSVEQGATLNVAYALSRPAVAAGETYTVRVVLATAGGDTTVETQASVEVSGPASLPPGVST
jgi:hypothetical protein